MDNNSFNLRDLDLVRLHSGIRGMTSTIMRSILQTCVDQSITLSDIFEMSMADIISCFPMVKPKVAQQIVDSKIETAEKTLEQLQSKGFQLITFLDVQYPSQYHAFGDKIAPLFYVYGDLALLQKAGIGFGGSRNVSTEGLHATDQLARYAVNEMGYTVVSGHAKGVDIIAHQSALAKGGETILVIPEGALKFRLKSALRAYWAEAKDRIVVMTQFAPHQPWQVRNAMERNTTAICLSKAFCVIESGDETGGTWQAGHTALQHNIPLYVLDYPDPPQSALGNKKLIAKGGIPIAHDEKLAFPSIDDIIPVLPTQRQLL